MCQVCHRCTRCPAPARVTWGRGEQRLPLCQHHSNQHGPALILEQWSARATLPELTANPATH